MNHREVGFPNCALTIGNRTSQHGHIQKLSIFLLWCILCNYNTNKYNWEQVLLRDNSKRRIVTPRDNPNCRPKGAHIESLQDIALKMERDYGRIRILLDINGDIETRYLICLRRNCRNLTKGGVKAHLARKRNGLHTHYDLLCHLCPETFKDLGSLGRHIYKNETLPILRVIRPLLIGEKYGVRFFKKTIIYRRRTLLRTFYS